MLNCQRVFTEVSFIYTPVLTCETNACEFVVRPASLLKKTLGRRLHLAATISLTRWFPSFSSLKTWDTPEYLVGWENEDQPQDFFEFYGDSWNFEMPNPGQQAMTAKATCRHLYLDRLRRPELACWRSRKNGFSKVSDFGDLKPSKILGSSFLVHMQMCIKYWSTVAIIHHNPWITSPWWSHMGMDHHTKRWEI